MPDRAKTVTADWLVGPDHRESTPYAYPAGHRLVRPIDTAVIHWTASPWQPRGPLGSDPARIRSWGRGERGQTSTHITILRDGTVLQLAPLSSRCWHAGGSVTADGRGSVNGRSVGIDLECVGPLSRDGWQWRNAYGGAHDGPVWQGPRGAWEPYTAHALHSLLTVVELLCAEVPALRDPAAWVGHMDIRPTKPDPGPHLPWGLVRAVVIGSMSPMDVVDWAALEGVVL